MFPRINTIDGWALSDSAQHSAHMDLITRLTPSLDSLELELELVLE